MFETNIKDGLVSEPSIPPNDGGYFVNYNDLKRLVNYGSISLFPMAYRRNRKRETIGLLLLCAVIVISLSRLGRG